MKATEGFFTPDKEYLTIEQRKVVNWYRKVLQNKSTPLWQVDALGFIKKLNELKSLKLTNYAQYFAQNPNTIRELSQSLHVIDINEPSLQQFGYGDLNAFLTKPIKNHIKDFGEALKILVIALLHGRKFVETEAKAVRKNQEAFNVSMQLILPEQVEAGDSLIVSVEELTETGPLSVKRFHNREVYQQFVNSAPVCIHEIDEQGRLQTMNSTGLNMMEVSAVEDIKGQFYLDLVDDADRDRIEELLDRAYEGYSSEFEFQLMTDSGKKIFTSCFIPLDEKNGRSQRIVGVTQDITKRKTSEQELYRLANFDPLTGLRNRTNFVDTANQYLAQAQRHNHQLAFLFIDLDKFKPINDQHGHPTGDLVLKEIAERLRNNLRKEDLICRYAGDEFVVLLTHITDLNYVNQVVKKIHRSLRVKMTDKLEFQLSASIGISLFPDHGCDVDGLIRQADTAMYIAKRAEGHHQVHMLN